jgi:ribosomal protein S18 acetylase RimI-like enzyme
MTISVRRMDVADVPALRELRLESLRLHPECFGADLETEEKMSVEHMAARMHTGYSFGGFSDNVLSGLVVFVKPNNKKTGHTGELGAMYVRANARGTGLADALVEAAIDQAVATGTEQIKLTVNADNPRAIKLYERHGFRPIGKFPNSLRVGDKTYEELIMLRTVSPTD